MILNWFTFYVTYTGEPKEIELGTLLSLTKVKFYKKGVIFYSVNSKNESTLK